MPKTAKQLNKNPTSFNKYGLYNEDDIGEDPSDTIKKIESSNKVKEMLKSKAEKKSSAVKVDDVTNTNKNSKV